MKSLCLLRPATVARRLCPSGFVCPKFFTAAVLAAGLVLVPLRRPEPVKLGSRSVVEESVAPASSLFRMPPCQEWRVRIRLRELAVLFRIRLRASPGPSPDYSRLRCHRGSTTTARSYLPERRRMDLGFRGTTCFIPGETLRRYVLLLDRVTRSRPTHLAVACSTFMACCSTCRVVTVSTCGATAWFRDSG